MDMLSYKPQQGIVSQQSIRFYAIPNAHATASARTTIVELAVFKPLAAPVGEGLELPPVVLEVPLPDELELPEPLLEVPPAAVPFALPCCTRFACTALKAEN